MITAIAGGTGSVKIARGIRRLTKDLTVVCNVGDNFWLHGLYICPDIDTIMYGLAGTLSRERGWGLEGDTFGFLEQLSRLGYEDWFKIGDKDLATHFVRTRLLSSGLTLGEATRFLCEKVGVDAEVIPSTDDRLETWIKTDKNVTIHLQEFWVKRKGQDDVLGVEYRGLDSAKPSAEFLGALEKSEAVVICPGNPITSILPIISIKGVKEKLVNKRVVSISPIVGNSPFSGPAGKLMKALGMEVSSLGVARIYIEFLTSILIHKDDAFLNDSIRALGIQPILEDTLMVSRDDETRLSRAALRSLGVLF